MPEKPPLGLIPKYAANSLRMKEILEAMIRYSSCRKFIPYEWIRELQELNENNKDV